jgi:hypothetical protein
MRSAGLSRYTAIAGIGVRALARRLDHRLAQVEVDGEIGDGADAHGEAAHQLQAGLGAAWNPHLAFLAADRDEGIADRRIGVDLEPQPFVITGGTDSPSSNMARVVPCRTSMSSRQGNEVARECCTSVGFSSTP